MCWTQTAFRRRPQLTTSANRPQLYSAACLSVSLLLGRRLIVRPHGSPFCAPRPRLSHCVKNAGYRRKSIPMRGRRFFLRAGSNGLLEDWNLFRRSGTKKIAVLQHRKQPNHLQVYTTTNLSVITFPRKFEIQIFFALCKSSTNIHSEALTWNSQASD